MKIRYIFVIFVVVSVALSGCSERASKEEPKEVKPTSEKAYEIIFSFPGDDFASQQDLQIINQIKIQLAEKGLAEVLSTGSGMGYMTMVFKLNREKPLDAVENIVQEVYPEARYRIAPAETMGPGFER